MLMTSQPHQPVTSFTVCAEVGSMLAIITTMARMLAIILALGTIMASTSQALSIDKGI